MKPPRLLGGLVAALLAFSSVRALGQQVRVPTRLPASTVVRVTSAHASEPATTPHETGAIPLSDGQMGDSACVPAPEVVVTDPCFPVTPVLPCVPMSVCPEYKWQFFGDFLWLQARNAEVAYAVPINGAIVPPAGVAPIQIGPVAIVDADTSPGFRVGFGRVLCSPARLGATYTHFESNVSDELNVSPPNVNRPLVIHPGTEAALPNFYDARAGYGIDFDLVDVDYHATFACDDHHVVDYLVGARYASLQQDFHTTFFNGGTTEQVATGIGFDGGGLRFGVEGERRSCQCGLFAYGRAAASFVAGRFRASYTQTDSFQGPLVDTGLTADRIVPILDLELGVGWTGPGEHLRLMIGYAISAWYNTVVTDEFIRAVQLNSFLGVSDTLTFDGLTARAEVRF